jgi:E3 ubiquitin-protein ligase listerin
MKKQFKSQASSARAGGLSGGFSSQTFGSSSSSILSYVQEPPDYSSLGDATVVVSFKNLSKKDATTKAKGLEELQTYVEAQNGSIDDPYFEAWVCQAVL